MIGTAIALIAGHVVADWALQPAELSHGKRSKDAITAARNLCAHGAIHAGFVLAATGSLWCAAAELVTHPLIDHAKARGWLTLEEDQALHIAMKVAYLFCLSVWGLV